MSEMPNDKGRAGDAAHGSVPDSNIYLMGYKHGAEVWVQLLIPRAA